MAVTIGGDMTVLAGNAPVATSGHGALSEANAIDTGDRQPLLDATLVRQASGGVDRSARRLALAGLQRVLPALIRRPC
jgi:hypothetical protein